MKPPQLRVSVYVQSRNDKIEKAQDFLCHSSGVAPSVTDLILSGIAGYSTRHVSSAHATFRTICGLSGCLLSAHVSAGRRQLPHEMVDYTDWSVTVS